MFDVKAHVKVVLEMDLMEAKAVAAALALQPADDPTDPIYGMLQSAVEQAERMAIK